MFNLNWLRVGWFLGRRQLQRSSLWSTSLIIIIMILTFLNLVVISGLLIGLIEGATVAVRHHYIGDVSISTLKEKNFIEDSQNIIKNLENIPQVDSYTARYTASGIIESNYKERYKFNEKADEVSTSIAGINPEQEYSVTGIDEKLIEGTALEEGDFDQVMIGALLMREYLAIDSPTFPVLDDVDIGSKVRIKIGDVTREMKVKGILKSKVDEIDRRVFMLDSQLRQITGRDDFNVGEIAVRLKNPDAAPEVTSILKSSGFDSGAKIQTFDEGKPKFLEDIKNTFALLGTIISSIGLLVAIITVFIVVFINAITRRKYIGIMKGIGITELSLEVSYVFQSIFYALIGSGVGLFIVYGLLVPYFDANPINFPFSDGILVAPVGTTIFRIFLLVFATILAGYIPARIIISQNTLDSILGRK